MSRYYLNQTAWVDGADPPTEQVRTCLEDSMWPVTNQWHHKQWSHEVPFP